MRTLLVILMLSVGASYAQAQDPGMEAAQQAQQQAQMAMQQAQMANMQAMQAAQQANQQAMQDAQRANEQFSLQCCAPPAAPPRFSLKPGKYDAPATVRMTDATRGAIIYYTTDGWTPTPKSHRYVGPITIDSTTTLQAVAIAPYCMRSLVASAQYTFATPAAAAPSATSSVTVPTPAAAPGAAANGAASAAASLGADQSAETIPAANAPGLLLARGTPVPLVFDVEVTSQTAQVGDKILMTLAEDLKVGDVVVAPKGSLAVGNVMQVDKTGAGGAPGDITFKAESLLVHGAVIELCGSAMREGQANLPNPGLLLIPVVGPFTVFKHGKAAVIESGTPFIASVRADTQIAPAK
ncbi:MAG: chitobiase/beta-hexosaminidase C-terminal domain-containing protein [Candidatus Acidiferrales bacterium]